MLYFVAVVRRELKKELELLQRRAATIVLKMVHLSTQYVASGLGWDPLMMKRETYRKFVNNCQLMIFMTMTLGLRIGYLLIKSISN